MPGNSFKNKKGFTLIEILISLGIIALVAAISIPNLRDFNKNQQIYIAGSQLVNVLKSAQSSAASRIKCPGNETAVSWQVNLNTSGSSDTYSFISNCLTLGPQTIINNAPFAQTPTDPVTFQADTSVCPGQNMTIYFTNLNVSYQCASGSILTGGIVITLTKPGTSLTKVIVIEQGGEIW